MLLFARQLHADRSADRARQQHRIGGDVVGAVAAIAAGGFHPDHVDFDLGRCQQQREIGAQHVRVLRAGPHPNLILRKSATAQDGPIEPCIWYGQM